MVQYQCDDDTRLMATLERMTIDYQAFMLFCVDYTGKFSNYCEDLLRLDGFAQSVENELNRIVTEEEGVREDP